ncbi:uncharacterized protein LOC113868719 [Abrus precatorius]|uniref:Uncharacterized protein LOC113868719 n=1 Tax=Abrus precatorius TaxID=3816 RepID=A0A8B8LXQ1_ABRPR|nr:uncharacterized protein LOC113868719 [Abrus precatorius]
MAEYLKHVLCFVLTLAAIYSCMAVDYVVSNNAESSTGGKLFDKNVGADYAKQTLSSAVDFTLKLFQQNTVGDRKNVQKISMIVENIDGIAYCSNNEIHVSASYIESYPGDVKKEITGLLYHEMAHAWQWNGNGQAPSGLVEGIADFVRLKAGYAAPSWVLPGHDDNWNQGYDVTARFLDYCNSIKNGFVADLNKMMKTSYSESYFTELLGKPVTQLWSDYKAKYGTN